MKTFGRLLLFFLTLIIIIPVIILTFAGLIPGLSPLLGTNKPRDLGITYTKDDLSSAREKSQISYDVLPETTPYKDSITRSGSHNLTAEFTSAEMTALLNDRPWKYWPYKNVQIKFNADGSAEISGIFDKSKLVAYGAAIDAPLPAVELAAKILPENPVFYVKLKAALKDNKVSVFEPQAFQIGKMPLPVNAFLTFAPPSLIDPVNALASIKDLDKVQNKKGLIVAYINTRLDSFTGFYANSAYFTEGKLIFDGTVSSIISYVK